MMTNTWPNFFQESYDGLDESQKRAINSLKDNIVIQASAGSGKTKSLTTAIAKYRYEHINDRICAITYTRAARGEMQERLLKMGVTDIDIRTIHSWCYSLLEEFAIKYDFKIKVLQEADIKTILKEIIIPTYLIRSRMKSINADIVYLWVTGGKNMDITDNFRRVLSALEERYQMYKTENHLYDFNDYPQYLYDVMKTYNEYINNIDALFVDEFQDVDPYQLWIFSRVNSDKKFYIGDQKQSIYVFRGADGEVFEKLDDFTEYQLEYNYRSYQEITNYATTVYNTLKDNCTNLYISYVWNSQPSNIKCARGYGGKVMVINPFGVMRIFSSVEGDRSVVNTAEVRQIVRDFLKKRPQILCRTNKQVRAIVAAGYDCSTIHQAKGCEYDNVVVVDSTLKDIEDLNIAYVALTRAKDNVLVINWQQISSILDIRSW